MGVNIGSFLAIAFTPIIAKYTNYSSAFIICVISMILALSNYVWRARIIRDLKSDAKPINTKPAYSTTLDVLWFVSDYRYIFVFDYSCVY